jgi:hypothetical protein
VTAAVFWMGVLTIIGMAPCLARNALGGIKIALKLD